MKYLALNLTVLLAAACGNRTVTPVSDGGEEMRGTDLARQDVRARLDVVKLDQAKQDTSSSCKHATVAKKCKKDSQGIEWCTIPAGCFQMGSPKTEKCRERNWGKPETQHQVTLTHKFEIQATEVTQAQFKSLIGFNPSFYSSCGNTCPVEQVSWYHAASYCNALSSKGGLNKCYACEGTGKSLRCLERAATKGKKIYSCEGDRLPTEAEWEYAYRAGTTTAFYSGDITNCHSADPNANKIAWYGVNSSWKTHPVGKKSPNAWGLFDMAGNAYEWCHDGDQNDLESSAVVDPMGPLSTYLRMVRGGSWNYDPLYVRAAYRYSVTAYSRYSLYGFRCVRTRK